jgi:hypothetical protein
LPLQLVKPDGHGVQTLGDPVQAKPGSPVQVALHPSKGTLLPSSHCSVPLTTPSPQTETQTLPEHTPLQHWLPTVHGAPTGPH